MNTPKKSNTKKTAARSGTTGTQTNRTKQTVETPAPEERYRLIAEAAYLLAGQRGFEGGSAQEDWLRAEKSVDVRLKGK